MNYLKKRRAQSSVKAGVSAVLALSLVAAMALLLTGCMVKTVEGVFAPDACGVDGGYAMLTEGEVIPIEPMPVGSDFNTEEYAAITEHGFTSVASMPFSTFGADIDTASYCNLRRMIVDGRTREEIPSGAVRVEEMLNYFDYSYQGPEGTELFGVTATIGDCPWNPDTKLLVLGLQARDSAPEACAGRNLVFLVDVSGSMASPDKLDLLKQSLTFLVNNLNPEDTISLVTYASGEKVLLDGATMADKKHILRVISRLEADGSTNGQAGLAMAYDVAASHFIEGGVNRIIMCSDGDLNVGITSQSDLEDFVSAKRETEVYLSVFGFGNGNYKDTKMETIADKGNGAYYYIDCLAEAERIFGSNLDKMLYTEAEDVKFQLEFNPAYVKGYRQIGYENRELAADDFVNDAVDAGEVHAGCQITVAYELVMTDSALELFTADSRYGQADLGVENGEWLCLQIRWKEPGEATAQQSTYVVGEESLTAEPGEDWVFASRVIEFAMLLQDSDYAGTSDLATLKEDVLRAHYEDELRAEFAQLVCRIL